MSTRSREPDTHWALKLIFALFGFWLIISALVMIGVDRAFGADAVAAVNMNETQRLLMENLALRDRTLQEQVERLRLDASNVHRRICGEAGIPAAECVIDPSAGVIRRQPATKGKADPPKPNQETQPTAERK